MSCTALSSYHVANSGYSEGKRHADAIEDLELSEGKKPKLSAEDASLGGADESAADVDGETLENSGGRLEPTPVTANAAVPEAMKDTRGKSKATKGADQSFKENPFTFLKHDDPVIQACM